MPLCNIILFGPLYVYNCSTSLDISFLVFFAKSVLLFVCFCQHVIELYSSHCISLVKNFKRSLQTKFLITCDVFSITDKNNSSHIVWNLVSLWSRDSIVGTVTKLRSGRSGVRTPAAARDFSLLQNVLTGSGAHAASYPMRTGVLSRGYSSRSEIPLTPVYPRG
jgi:hypothetical protein